MDEYKKENNKEDIIYDINPFINVYNKSIINISINYIKKDNHLTNVFVPNKS